MIATVNSDDLDFAARARVCCTDSSTFFALATLDSLLLFATFSSKCSCPVFLFLEFRCSSSLFLLGMLGCKMLLTGLVFVERGITRKTPAETAHLAVEDVSVVSSEESTYVLR